MRTMWRLFGLMIAWLALSMGILPAAAQGSAVITLTAEAGFSGYFRPDQWFPVLIRVSNDGADVSGRLVVRPETSGVAIPNTFSTPITLASGARQTAQLYVSARSFASQLRVELIDEAGVALAAQPVTIRAAAPQDRLYALISEAPAGTLDLSSVSLGGYNAYQVDWAVSSVPDQASMLDSLSMIVFDDADTSALSESQRIALRDWVISGGHLVVAGGANYAAAVAGLLDLLPITPERAITVENLNPIAAWLGHRDPDALNRATVITVGTIGDGAQVLAGGDEQPLIVRRTLGAGTVDFIAADPNTEPLRSWAFRDDLWLTLQMTRGAQPGWINGVTDFESARRASSILPGFDPLPDIMPLILFLLAYILLVGPVNYVVLNRVNRREWAWLTIPACIAAFSALAYGLGTQIRGTDATLNRLTVIRSYPDTDLARADSVIGLLAPRRGQYSLGVEPGAALRPIPLSPNAGGGFGGTVLARDAQTNADIRQSDRFVATDFTVDASFIAGFYASAMLEKPAISGTASIAYDLASGVPGQLTVRGSVTNDSDQPLLQPVILARGVAVRLGAALEAGDLTPFEITLPGTGFPAPVPYLPTASSQVFNIRTARITDRSEQTTIDILGTERYSPNIFRFSLSPSAAELTNWRDQYLVAAFVDDSYGSTSRADAIYLAGWLEGDALPVDLLGADFDSAERTLVITRLNTQLTPPGAEVLITGDRFGWTIREYVGLGEVTPVELSLQPGEEVEIQFTPEPTAVLDTVTELRLRLDDVSIASARRLPLNLYNWTTGTWDEVIVSAQTLTIRDHARYLGAQNSVRIRVIADTVGSFLRLGRLSVEQRGTFG